MLPLLLLGMVGTAGYMHLDNKIDNTRSDVVVLRKYENETRATVNVHQKALESLGPTDTWMNDIK